MKNLRIRIPLFALTILVSAVVYPQSLYEISSANVHSEAIGSPMPAATYQSDVGSPAVSGFSSGTGQGGYRPSFGHAYTPEVQLYESFSASEPYSVQSPQLRFWDPTGGMGEIGKDDVSPIGSDLPMYLAALILLLLIAVRRGKVKTRASANANP